MEKKGSKQSNIGVQSYRKIEEEEEVEEEEEEEVEEEEEEEVEEEEEDEEEWPEQIHYKMRSL